MANKEQIRKFFEKWEKIAQKQENEDVAKGMRSVLADLYQQFINSGGDGYDH